MLLLLIDLVFPFPKITTAHIPRCLSSPNLRNLMKLSQAQRPIHYLSHQQPLKISVTRAKLSSSKGDFLRLGTSHAADTLRTYALRARGGHPRMLSSEQQPTAAHQPPSCLGCLPKASVANGAGAAVFFVASSESKVVSATATENDGPSDMEALYAGLSAAGAGALWVEVVVRDEGGTPIRLTSWAKSSVTSSIKRAGAWGEGWLSGDSVLRGDGLAAATFARFFLLSLLPLETFHTLLGSC